MAALLAGACVAPVVIQVVLFSSDLYARGTTIALALPFVLGIGMAIPWPIAGAGIAALPKPGAWMVRVKQVLGVVILATATYYAYQAYSIFSNRWVDPAAVESSVQEKLKAGWYSSMAAGLDAAKREQKPVLIDLWATWCKNCLVMDNTTLKDPARHGGARRVREDQVPGRGSGQRAREVDHAAIRGCRPSRVRDPAPEESLAEPAAGRTLLVLSIALWYSGRVRRCDHDL